MRPCRSGPHNKMSVRNLLFFIAHPAMLFGRYGDKSKLRRLHCAICILIRLRLNDNVEWSSAWLPWCWDILWRICSTCAIINMCMRQYSNHRRTQTSPLVVALISVSTLHLKNVSLFCQAYITLFGLNCLHYAPISSITSQVLNTQKLLSIKRKWITECEFYNC